MVWAGVVLVGRGDIDDVHLRVCAEALHGVVAARLVAFLEGGENAGVDVAAGDELEAGMGLHGGQDFGAAHADAYDAKVDDLPLCFCCHTLSLAPRACLWAVQALPAWGIMEHIQL